MRGGAPPISRDIKTMIDVIMNEPSLCLRDSLLDRIQLLRQIEAAATFIEHRDDTANMPLRPLEAFDDIRMSLMGMHFRHAVSLIPPGGIGQGMKLAYVVRSLLRLFVSEDDFP